MVLKTVGYRPTKTVWISYSSNALSYKWLQLSIIARMYSSLLNTLTAFDENRSHFSKGSSQDAERAHKDSKKIDGNYFCCI